MKESSGQSLVEFALVLPVLMLLVVGVMEFAMALNSWNTIFYASRDAAMIAAEGGATDGTDCVVLDRIERDVVAPARSVRIQSVAIYWSDRNGVQQGDDEHVYSRTGSTTCTFAGSTVTVPYTVTTANYPTGERCDVLSGCGGGHSGPDNIGVRITYEHLWVTSIVKSASAGARFTMTAATRIEPQK